MRARSVHLAHRLSRAAAGVAALVSLASGVAWLASSALTAGCSSASSPACAPQGTVTVQVTDEDVDDPANFLCTATVTIAHGSGATSAGTPLKPQGLDGSNAGCGYVVSEGPGTYTLQASANGYTSMSQTLSVTQASCVTESVSVHMGLFQDHAPVDAGEDDVNVFRMPDGGLPDATRDAGVDSALRDAGVDVGVDTGPPAVDAGHDAPDDAPRDVAHDAPHDAEHDAPHDAPRTG